ncbi:hypothetical protein Syun_015077 [Stephania yunnanensis]|uniref:Uncharacterized protein n=1 Tax=Stephania yunnanensis TaxID=152371 RepID=A0AAP0JKN1_9MAGN
MLTSRGLRSCRDHADLAGVEMTQLPFSSPGAPSPSLRAGALRHRSLSPLFPSLRPISLS